MNVEQHGTPRHHGGRLRGLAWFPASIVVVVAAVLLGAMIGPAGPPAWRIPLAFLDHIPGVHIDSGVSETQWAVIWNIRMPRVVLAGIVGAMLSVGGASYQGVFRNPLVDPYLLGAAAGAGLGATLMIAVWGDVGHDWPIAPVPLVSFFFASATVALTYAVGASFGGLRSGTTLVLAGVAVVSLMTAIQTFVLQRHSEVVREVYNWILGRRKNRMGEIQQFKNERFVGESRDGLLVIRMKPEGEYGDYVRVTVEEENADRMQLMKSLAEGEKTSLPEIQAKQAELWRNRSFKDEWIEAPGSDGSWKWVQKEG